MTHADVTFARKWATYYRSRGFNPLPSRTDKKCPLIRYSEWWDTPVPASLFDRFATTNIQVMCGRRWRLLVIDLDGPEAVEWWNRKRHGRQYPWTWATHPSGENWHLWYRLPADYPTPLPRAVLWKGDGEHSAVERLCDKSIVMAPPSFHPTTGERYLWRGFNRGKGVTTFADLGLPAFCPAWILALKPLAPTRSAYVPPTPSAPVAVPEGRYRAADVLAAIRDPISVARDWGVRLAASRPNAAGWYPCHAIGREDRSPSASLSAVTGRYWEPGFHRTLGLFDLGVHLGRYADWRDACNDLGRTYLGEAG